MSRVSVIIVNYNGTGLIRDCLKALEWQSFKDFEVVVVDNGSSDHSIDEISEFLKENPDPSFAKFIRLGKNCGFAGGNIEGLHHAKGEYIALLNNDAEPERTWLEELVLSMDSEPKVGICASKMIVYGTNFIDSAGDGFSKFLKGFKRGEGRESFLFGKREYVFGACAGAALYRRRMIDEIGFLDQDFFMIHEDTDLNLRAHLYGWKVLYVPEAKVYHKVSSSLKKMREKAIYYTLRNSDFVLIKNLPFGIIQKNLIPFSIRMVLDFIYFALKHKKWRIYFLAKIDMLRMMPKMLRKRRIIMKNRKAEASYLLSLVTSGWEKEFLKFKIKKLFYEHPH